ncbi:MAG: SdpI family protein [Steroidobacteraceae bacterium]
MKPVLALLHTYWIVFAFVAVNLLLLASLYNRLPDPMPWMWDVDGTATHWISKLWGALLLPAAHLLITLFLVFAPAVDPGALRTREAPRFYPFVVAVISCFLLLTTCLHYAAALGTDLSVPHALLGGTGLLFAVVGNYLGKVPRNYMVGIRTPWTLCNDYVWERTHRFAAPLFVCGGLAVLVHCLTQRGPLSTAFISTTITTVLLAPYCYSFVTWRRMQSAHTA